MSCCICWGKKNPVSCLTWGVLGGFNEHRFNWHIFKWSFDLRRTVALNVWTQAEGEINKKGPISGYSRWASPRRCLRSAVWQPADPGAGDAAASGLHRRAGENALMEEWSSAGWGREKHSGQYHPGKVFPGCSRSCMLSLDRRKEVGAEKWGHIGAWSAGRRTDWTRCSYTDRKKLFLCAMCNTGLCGATRRAGSSVYTAEYDKHEVFCVLICLRIILFTFCINPHIYWLVI